MLVAELPKSSECHHDFMWFSFFSSITELVLSPLFLKIGGRTILNWLQTEKNNSLQRGFCCPTYKNDA